MLEFKEEILLPLLFFLFIWWVFHKPGIKLSQIVYDRLIPA